MIVRCFKIEGPRHSHQQRKDKMKYKDAEFLLLSSNQQDCSLRNLTEAGITPSLSPHIGLYFKHATRPTHGDHSYSAMIQFARKLFPTWI